MNRTLRSILLIAGVYGIVLAMTVRFSWMTAMFGFVGAACLSLSVRDK